MLAALAERHGVPPGTVARLPDTGIFNAIYALGDRFILRVPRRHPLHDEALWKESIVVPLARAAGVRAPELLSYDTSCSVLPVPYVLYERVPGETLAHLDLEPEEASEVWRETGRDLARLHHRVERGGEAAGLPVLKPGPDPRDLAERLATGGWITASETRWLTRWLDRLAPAALAPITPHLIHGDLQTTNIMVRPDSSTYAALIDWGGAGWADPALDFAGVPLRAVPFMLEGYREIASLEGDDTAEERILWRHLQLALYTASRSPQPDHSWAERPLTMGIEIARFFASPRPGAWSRLRPNP